MRFLIYADNVVAILQAESQAAADQWARDRVGPGCVVRASGPAPAARGTPTPETAPAPIVARRGRQAAP